MDQYFNTFKNLRSKEIDNSVSLNELLQTIKTGANNIPLISAARSYYKGDKQYDLLKEMLPAVAWNVTFSDGRKTENIKSMSGYMYFDKDTLSENEIRGYKESLSIYPFVYAVWKSLGGHGIGCLIKVENVDQSNFKDAWDQINEEIEIEFDKGTRKITQVNVISYDPDIYINDSTEVFKFCDDNISTTYDRSNILFTSDASEGCFNMSENYWNSCLSTERVKFDDNNKENIICYHIAPSPPNNKLSFQTQLSEEAFNGNMYRVFENGIDWLKIYCPKVIPEGKRNSTLISITTNLILLNQGNQRNHLFATINSINENHCKPPLEKKQVESIFNYCYNRFLKGELYAKPLTRYIVFNQNLIIPLKEKRKINGRETGKLRRSRREKQIIDAYQQLIAEGKTSRQIDVANSTGLSLRTIKGYWHKVKEFNQANFNDVSLTCADSI